MSNIRFSLHLPAALFFAACFFSCGGTKEDPLVREQKAMDKMAGETEVEFYRAFKTAVRSFAADSLQPGFAEARTAVLGLAGKSLHIMDSATAAKQNFIEMASNVKALYNAKDVLLKTDEDTLPTILENIFSISGQDLKSNEGPGLFASFQEDEEHLFLGAAWYVSHKVPKSFMLYEINRVHDERLLGTEMRVASKLLKSIAWLENDWPYHAEKTADEYLAVFDKEKKYLLANPLPAIDTNTTPSPEQAWHQWKAIGFALRAVSHLKMDESEKKEIAYEDFDSFLKEAETGGLDNELTWTIGAVVAVKKEDKEKAVAYLTKIENSKMFSEEEKEAATAAKKYVENRDNGSALNTLYDKLAIASVTGSYMMNRVNDAKPIAAMRKTEAGKKFTGLAQEAEQLAPLSAGAADSLINKTKDQIKGLFK